ncbi:MAG: GNAT family N-acetyltransferase [Chloroflexota bacterium]|nr:GNAT family N-acetyltransferase [Chloroflexota bacterium]
MTEPRHGRSTPATIREITDVADLASLVTLMNTITPDNPTSLEEIRWSDATYPGATRFLAELDARAVGVATVGRIYVHPPDHPDLWATIAVKPEARRQGIGESLLVAVSERARSAGKTGLQLRTSEARPEGIRFLEHRGFREIERSKTVRLELAGLEAPRAEAPPGISLTTLADRPDLVSAIHAVALEAFADIPGGAEPDEAGDLAEFRARDVDRPGIPADAFMVALDALTGEVVGYASLMLVPGSTTVAWHDMTAVRRSWRGRGIATVLKQRTIAWAIRSGLTALETGNDEANGPMRAVNARLGYRPLPDEIFFRGPLFSGVA